MVPLEFIDWLIRHHVISQVHVPSIPLVW